MRAESATVLAGLRSRNGPLSIRVRSSRSSMTVTAGQQAQAVPGERTREVTLDPKSLRTLRSNQGPGQSLPGPDAGHPLHGACCHRAVPMIGNIRGMNLAVRSAGLATAALLTSSPTAANRDPRASANRWTLVRSPGSSVITSTDARNWHAGSPRPRTGAVRWTARPAPPAAPLPRQAARSLQADAAAGPGDHALPRVRSGMAFSGRAGAISIPNTLRPRLRRAGPAVPADEGRPGQRRVRRFLA